MTAVALTIAGSDSGGGAGIQADLKTFQECKVFGCSAVTAVTAQNTREITAIEPVAPEIVTRQLTAVFDDFPVAAVKTGMLFSAEIIAAVARILKKHKIPLVVDPVMVSKSKEALLKREATRVLTEELLPLATVVTPNIPEAEALTGIKLNKKTDFLVAAEELRGFGAANIVIKGGHSPDPRHATDYVFIGKKAYALTSPRIATTETHGTGCTFSAAITANLALGLDLLTAITRAKEFTEAALSHPLNLGHGFGPTNHFAYQELSYTLSVEIHEC